jgi:hypothetical protein
MIENSYTRLVLEEVRQAFWQIYGYDSTEERYEAFASTWGGLSLEHMRRVLVHGEGEDRFCAMLALGASTLPDVADLLLPFLHSARRAERCVSAIALGRRNDERAYPFLEALLLDGVSLEAHLQAAEMQNQEILEDIYFCDQFRSRAVELLASWQSAALIQTMIEALKTLWELDRSPADFWGNGHFYNRLCYALGQRDVVTAFDEIGLAPAYLRIAQIYFALGHFQVQARPTFMRAVLASADLRQQIIAFLEETFHVEPEDAQIFFNAFYYENQVRIFYRYNQSAEAMQKKLIARFIAPLGASSLSSEEDEQVKEEAPEAPAIEQIEPSFEYIYQGHALPIWSVSWSPDGVHLVSGSADMTAQVWNWKTQKQVHLFKEHQASVNVVAWSPDGRWIASGGGDNRVLVWEPHSGKVVTAYKEHTGWLHRGLAWSPDGTRLASAPWDGTVHIWEALTGKTLTIYRGHGGIVTSVAWSPDGMLLVSGGGYPECAMHVWNAATGRCHLIYRAHMQDGDHVRPLLPGMESEYDKAWGRAASSVRSVVWSPDGQWIASAGLRMVFRVWKATTGEDVLALAQDRTNGPLAWSADSKEIIAANHDRVDVWNIAQQRVITSYAPLNLYAVTALSWSPDMTMIAAGGEYPRVCVWQK